MSASPQQPPQGQEAPAAADAQAAALSLSDRFSQDLEALSKRLGVAIVAEGEPFPQAAPVRPPSLNPNLSPDNAVKEVADFFDYDFVRQGNAYILTKRYTHPDDLPDVTPEECRFGLKRAQDILRFYEGGFFGGHGSSHGPVSVTLEQAIFETFGYDGLSQQNWALLTTDGLPFTTPGVDFVSSSAGIRKFFFHTFIDRIDGIFFDMDNRPPLNPYFHWKTLGNIRAFGYETFKVDFIPFSDFNRVVVPDYTAPLPRAGYLARNDIAPENVDPTEPVGLSDQAKQFLEASKKPSHAVTLTKAVEIVNKGAVNSGVYGVDSMYAPKHVTLAGMDRISAQEGMEALATVYGLGLNRRPDGTTVLTSTLPFKPAPYHFVPNFDNALISVVPAPIAHLFHTHHLPGHYKDPDEEMPGSKTDPKQYVLKGTNLQTSALQSFRYIAEPIVKAQASKQQMLSYFGTRARNLFQFARMLPMYADVCGLADSPLPPYIVETPGDLIPYTTLTGGRHGDPNAPTQLLLSFRYENPQKNIKYGPVRFFDGVIPPLEPPDPNGVRVPPTTRKRTGRP